MYQINVKQKCKMITLDSKNSMGWCMYFTKRQSESRSFFFQHDHLLLNCYLSATQLTWNYLSGHLGHERWHDGQVLQFLLPMTFILRHFHVRCNASPCSTKHGLLSVLHWFCAVIATLQASTERSREISQIGQEAISSNSQSKTSDYQFNWVPKHTGQWLMASNCHAFALWKTHISI